MSVRSEVVYNPEEAARRLGGISVAMLIRLLKERNYRYVNLHPDPDAKPWGRGRKTWGLSESQLAVIVDGQTRQMPGAAAKAEAPARPAAALPGHDGKSRLRRRAPGA